MSRAEDAGISVPTVLARRAALSGTTAFGAFVVAAGLLATAFVDRLFAWIAVMLGAVLALLAVGFLRRAFRERRRLVAVRHVKELVEMLGEVPLAVVAAETGRSVAAARTLVERAVGRGEIAGRVEGDILRSAR